MRWLSRGVVLACALLMAPPAWADSFARIQLADGREFFGKVVEEDEYKIVLEIVHGSIRAPMTFAAADIESIERIEKSDESARDELDALRSPEVEAEAEEVGGYAIVPAIGGIGEELTAQYFERALLKADNADAELVIFHVESPGGLVYELEAIHDALEAYEGDAAIAFYVDDQAFSAAALLCLSGEHFFVGEGARVGAAVAFSTNSGAAEVDAKFNSAFASTWRGHAERVGRPGELVDAMIVMESELWADQATEPWRLWPSKPDGVGGELVRIDGERTVLSLTHEQAVATGAADALLAEPRLIALRLDLDEPQHEAFDGESFYRSYSREYTKNIGEARKALRQTDTALKLLGGEKTVRDLKTRLRKIRTNLLRLIRLYESKDYVRNYVDGHGVTTEQMEGIVRSIDDVLRQL
jgi:hypothetical protein